MESYGAIRILACPNAYKGSLSAAEASRAIAEGVEQASCSSSVLPALETCLTPLADGGDGTLETLVSATGGTLHSEQVTGPTGRRVTAPWGRLGGDRSNTGVIEMARASGLSLLPQDALDPLHASTAGTGELMLAAVRAGCTRLIVGIGGSATNDGGAGMATALGARILDSDGRDVPPGGAALIHARAIDLSGWLLPPGVTVTVACDVDNPLTGPQGAAAVYGPQKGATPAMVQQLDRALSLYGSLLESTFAASIAALPGAGAAGGLGAGLMAFCGATLQPGAELVLAAVDFDAKLSEAEIAITGEGRLDSQTGRGKAIALVAERCRQAGKPCIALCGSVVEDARVEMRERGLLAAIAFGDGCESVEYAMQHAYGLLRNAARGAAGIIQALYRKRGSSEAAPN